MRLNSFNSIPKMALTFLMIVGASTTFSKNAIQALTSKKNAKQAPQAAAAETPVPTLTTAYKHSLGLGLGQTFLYSDFADNGDDKISAELLYNYAANHSFDLLVNYHYSNHEFARQETTIQGLVSSVKAKFFQFDNFSPFGLAGLGFYAPKLKRYVNGSLKESESKLVFGWNAGAGFDLKLNRHFMAGMLLQFHNPFDVKQDLDPEVEGAYFKLLLTSYYTF